jgi:hypothetical protein
MKKTVKRRNGKKSVKKNAKKRVSTRKNKQRGGMNWVKILFILIVWGFFLTQTQEKLELHETGSIDRRQIDALIHANMYSKFLFSAIDRYKDPSKSAHKFPPIDKYSNFWYKDWKHCYNDMDPHISKLVDSGVSLPDKYTGNNRDESTYAQEICKKQATSKLLDFKYAETYQTCVRKLSDPIIDKTCYRNVVTLNVEPNIENFRKIQDLKNGIQFGNAKLAGHKGPDANNSVVFKINDGIILSILENDITPQAINEIGDVTDSLLKKNEHSEILKLLDYVSFTTNINGYNYVRLLYKNGNLLSIEHVPDDIFNNLRTTYGEITEEANLPYSLFGKSPNPNAHIMQSDNIDNYKHDLRDTKYGELTQYHKTP